MRQISYHANGHCVVEVMMFPYGVLDAKQKRKISAEERWGMGGWNSGTITVHFQLNK